MATAFFTKDHVPEITGATTGATLGALASALAARTSPYQHFADALRRAETAAAGPKWSEMLPGLRAGSGRLERALLKLPGPMIARGIGGMRLLPLAVPPAMLAALGASFGHHIKERRDDNF